MSFKFNPLTGKLDIAGTGGGGSTTTIEPYYVVDEITISAAQALAKEVTLSTTPPTPGKVSLDIVGGTSQDFGADYMVIGDKLIWNGYDLDVTLEENDKIRIIYPI